MSTRISIKQKLLGHLEDADSILRSPSINIVPLLDLLLEKDQQLKETYKETFNEIQKKIDELRVDSAKSDKQIHTFQLQLKKAESVLSTALYYSRQKLDAMSTSVKNPVDMEEIVRFSHRISASHGAIAPENWIQGDPRRPYPNQEEIRRGYLGHLDDSGNFRPSLWEALSETYAAAASLASSSQNSSVINTPVVNQTHIANQNVQNLPSVTCSPSMMLPGVNMVSSPMSIPQTANTWCGSSDHPSNNLQNGTPRSTASLAAMLSGSGSHENITKFSANVNLPPPPPLRSVNNSHASSPSQPTTKSTVTSRSVPSNRTISSPGSFVPRQQPNPPYGELSTSSNVKSNQLMKQTRRKHMDDAEMISSNSSTDSSSEE